MASKPEQIAWDVLARQMRGRWRAQRHEDKYSPDIPDVSFVAGRYSGWIELKAAQGWDESLEMRPGQLNWLMERAEAQLTILACWLRTPDISGGLWLALRVHPENRPLLMGRVTATRLRGLGASFETHFAPIVIKTLEQQRESHRRRIVQD